MAHHRLPRVSLKGTVHYEEDFVRQLGTMLESPADFLFNTTDDVTAEMFSESLVKAIDKNKPGLTFKVVCHSQLVSEHVDAVTYFKRSLAQAISEAVNNHSNVNNAFLGRNIVSVSLLEMFSYVS
ncbi:E4 ORF D [Canine mastadenovirus A]|uniref:E4 ORF D n=2 Tax=Canine mastadenovirus A TaxID=10537 RepID=A0A1J0MUM7_9ADEN|nr:E4 orf4 [Canine adenovirus 1]APD29227.1 orf27 [Canine mastadenovirus A]AXE71643.1 Orf27 [Canine mastadenovirus A]UKI59095.1 orf27 [Canine mastadenovirus A]BCG66221.1 E4 ORF D [Canine mastadenovirus A]